MWICPVTDKKIDANDTAAIDAHKKELIVKQQLDAQKKEFAKKAKNAKKVLDLELNLCGSLAQVTQAYRVYIETLFPGTPLIELDIQRLRINAFPAQVAFSILNAKKLPPEVLTHLKAVDAKGLKALLKVPSAEVPKGVSVLCVPARLPWYTAVHRWQNAEPRSFPKVTEESHKTLQSVPEYVAAVKKLNAVATKLHDLKLEHKKLNALCEDIRVKVLVAQADTCPYK